MEADIKIVQDLIDSENWPEFERAEHLSKLNTLADEASNATSGYSPIAAILIYQQLTEEVLRLLLRFSRFFIKAKLYPWKIEYKDQRGAMFGRLVEELKQTMEFENKKEILKVANEINEIRISVAHGLPKLNNTIELKNQSQLVKSKFDELISLYFDSEEWFRNCLREIKKDYESFEDDY